MIADLGSGTGKFSKLLLEFGLRVFGLEPNENMRKMAGVELSQFKNFTSISASAEETGLSDASIDLITVAQAFHWFDRKKCKKEFKRILKPNGCVALIWNRFDLSENFMNEYQMLIDKYNGEYPKKDNKIESNALDKFFEGNYKFFTFFWNDPVNFSELWGRAQSSSYAPASNHPNYKPRKEALSNLFDSYNTDGKVDFKYKTELFIGSFPLI